MVEILFKVRLGVDEKGEAIYWQRKKVIVFTLKNERKSLESLQLMGLPGDEIAALLDPNVKLNKVVEVTIDPPQTKEVDGKFVPYGDPQISWISPIGGMRYGKAVSAAKVKQWSAGIAARVAAARNEASSANKTSGNSMPHGFDAPGSFTVPNQDAMSEGDDIPF